MIRSESDECSRRQPFRPLKVAGVVAAALLTVPASASDPAFPTAEQIAAAARAIGQSADPAKPQDIRFCPGDPADVERLKEAVRCYVARKSAADGMYHVIASYDLRPPAGGHSVMDRMVRFGRWLYEAVTGPASPPADPSSAIDDAVGAAVRQSSASLAAAAQVNRGTADATREATEMFGEIAQSAVRGAEMDTPLGLDLMPVPAMPPAYPNSSNSRQPYPSGNVASKQPQKAPALDCRNPATRASHVQCQEIGY